jgi:hypothetical protein
MSILRSFGVDSLGEENLRAVVQRHLETNFSPHVKDTKKSTRDFITGPSLRERGERMKRDFLTPSTLGHCKARTLETRKELLPTSPLQ